MKFQHPAGNEPKHPSYRPEIDGLRAIAVVAVIINHFNKDILPNGFLGVDIFFVISGFVITSSLMGRSWVNARDFLLSFYVRRIKRLVPALVACVLVTGVAICLFDPRPEASLQTGIASLFGFSNIVLMRQSVDYFGDSTQYNPFTHTWSLGVEEQFYLLFPFLFLFSGIAQLKPRGIRNLTVVIGILSLASLLAFIQLSRSNPSIAYFLMPTRFWEIGVGCLLFLVLQQSARLQIFFQQIPALAVGLALISVLFTPYKLKGTLAIVLLTCILLASCRPSTSTYRILTAQPMLRIGLLSYSLYLWHWPVVSISRWTLGLRTWTLPIQIALIVALACLSYYYLEVPLRRAQWSSRLWQTLAYGVSATGAAASGLSVLVFTDLHRWLFTADFSSEMEQISIHEWQRKKLWTPWAQRSGKASDTRCYWWMGEGPAVEEALKRCKISSQEGQVVRRFFILGDSHTGKLLGWYGKVPSIPGTMARITNVGGQIVPVDRSPSWLDSEREHREADMKTQQDIIEATLNQLQPGDTMILSSYFRLQFRTAEQREKPGQQAGGRSRWQLWLDDLENLVQRASAKGASVVLLLPTPDFVKDEAGDYVDQRICSRQWFRPQLQNGCFLQKDRQELAAEINTLATPIRAIEARHPNFHTYDPFEILCPKDQTTCTNYLHGKRMYVDNNHVNLAAIRLVAKDFDRFLQNKKLLPADPR